MLGDDHDTAVIMRGPKKHGLVQQFLSDVDWGFEPANRLNNVLIIDTPPGTSDEHLSVSSILQSCNLALPEDRRARVCAVMVSTPQEVALADVRKELNFCQKIQLPVLGLVENMSGFVCPGCKHVTEIFSPGSGGCAKMCAEHNVRFLGKIPLDPALMKAGEQGCPWSQLADDESPGLEMFMDVVAAILN